jgi:hypothetical protein
MPPTVLATVLAACSAGGGDAAAPSPSAVSLAPDEADRGPSVNSSAQPHAIPEAMVGKWGIGLADCDPSTGADKGVMTVAPDSLKFFESSAQLAAVVSGNATRIRAAFAFAGEGTNWTREEELTLQSGGKSLIRRELGGSSPMAPATYIRCPRS